MLNLIKKLILEQITKTKVICDKCGWSWNIKDGGKDPYLCHKCGHDNTPKKKLKEQNFNCPICKRAILEHQRTAGDHIVEFCRGGNTTYENLQILHKVCHDTKNMVV
jgi:5-methylcytosine-specific restriction endonuclease McrA